MIKPCSKDGKRDNGSCRIPPSTSFFEARNLRLLINVRLNKVSLLPSLTFQDLYDRLLSYATHHSLPSSKSGSRPGDGTLY